MNKIQSNTAFETRNLMLREHLAGCPTCKGHLDRHCDVGDSLGRAAETAYDAGDNMYAKMAPGRPQSSGVYVGSRADLLKERALLTAHIDETKILAQFNSHKLGFLAFCWHEFYRTDFAIDLVLG